MSVFDMWPPAGVAEYNSRKVGLLEHEDGLISTVAVRDGEGALKPFETMVQSRRYDLEPVVVQIYDTKEEAEAGHLKWVALFTGPDGALPAELVEVLNIAPKRVKRI